MWGKAKKTVRKAKGNHKEGLDGQNTFGAKCSACDLCRKRVLIVGGITKIKALYRELVENKGGLFDYHDGYMKNSGVKKLESRFRRADIVLCPVNCNSHNACLMVKHFAKKHNKAVHMLPGSSLSAVSQTLSAAGKVGGHGVVNSNFDQGGKQ